MKKWQMGLGVLLVAGLALAGLFINGGTEAAKGKQGQGAAPTNQLSETGQEPAKGAQPAAPKPGFPAPDFTLNDMQGNPVKLSDLKGKRVLVNFWASWCPPCQAEMPELVAKSEKYKDKIVFLGVNLTSQDPKADGPKKFVEKFNVKYPNLMDVKGEVGSLYQVTGIPTTITIGADGVIVDRHMGGMSGDQMEQMIQNLLKE
ncbi:TlpA family protein disulfide reductase [Effusibacillus lacus]|uniref:Cytochrome c biogenesis protein n=1 Tax=Effusibacillus lacus TaxID=1348429 RepID=A0A292YM15_9BACL|nr:redoxin domain-containing protein [Effusibacillus lacus]TCS72318.1 peroxiredoxin [Effusibacillus lacus]GAX90216.1 cytochrome c biogenesis protein [Effusibacillus lacus]